MLRSYSCFSFSYSSLYSCLSSSGMSRQVCPIIFPISQSGSLGFSDFTESQTFLENLIYGIKGFSGAFGGLGTPFPVEFGLRGAALWGLKVGLLYWPGWKGFDLSSSALFAPIGLALGDDP